MLQKSYSTGKSARLCSHRYNLLVLIVLAIPLKSHAQERMSDEGIMNMGSSLAYIALCERNGLIKSKTTRTLFDKVRNKIGIDNWERMKHQYQISLHEKQQYSIARNSWYQFHIDAEHCNDLNDALPFLETFLE